MRERDFVTAKRFGVLERIQEFEKKLLEVDHVIDVEFDLDGFYDDIRQVIFLPRYDIPYDTPDYFEVRKTMLQQCLDVAKGFGLNSSGDRIEDYGEHFYIVRSCDKSWVLQQEEEYIEPDVATHIEMIARDVVSKYDWTMPEYNVATYEDYDEYDSECLDIGHDRKGEIFGFVKQQLIVMGKFTPDDDSYYELIEEIVWDEITNCICENMDDIPMKKVFEVWKDCELGQTYKEREFSTQEEADAWISRYKNYYPGWHLRVVPVEVPQEENVPKKRFFMMDAFGVDVMTCEGKNATVESAMKAFWDLHGYSPDVVKSIDELGGTLEVFKDVTEGIDRVIANAKERSELTDNGKTKVADFVKE